MPTNLPPEYYEAEERYRDADTLQEKIETLEALIGTIPKHKGTDKLRANFRRRLSKLKTSSQSKTKTSAPVSAFHIDKEGAGQAVVIGQANVGKSALVAKLTNATPEVSPYPFTTWSPTPGMMAFEGVQIQLIDTPPLNREFLEPEFVQLLRRADIILLMVDLTTDPVQQLEDSLATLKENKIAPLRLKGEAANRGVKCVPTLVLCNKHDDESMAENYEIFCALIEKDWPLLPVSVETGLNLDVFKQRVFEQLDVMRVYSKAPGKEPDMDTPFILKRGSTVEEMALKVHKDFYENLKSARVWGAASFEGQMVSRDHVLHDGDVVELKI